MFTALLTPPSGSDPKTYLPTGGGGATPMNFSGVNPLAKYISKPMILDGPFDAKS